MISTIHSIQNIFGSGGSGPAASCLTYLQIEEKTKDEELQSHPNFFVAVSKAASLHIFFYRIYHDENHSNKSKFFKVRSKDLDSIELECIKLVFNQKRKNVSLIGVTSDGRILMSDAVAFDKDILLYDINFQSPRPALGMNLLEVRETMLMNGNQDVTFLIAGTNSLSPPAIATISMNDYGEIDESILTEIRGLEDATSKLTALKCFDMNMIDSEARDVLLSLCRTSVRLKGYQDSFHTMSMVVLLGYSDGSIYISLASIQHNSTKISVSATPASKIFQMTLPAQSIISICISRENRKGKSCIIFVGSLCSIAVICGNVEKPMIVPFKAYSYCGNLVYAQLLPSPCKTSNQVNRHANEDMKILALTDSGIAGTLSLSFEVQRQSKVEFQTLNMKKAVSYIYASPVGNGSKLNLIVLTLHGCLSLYISQSIDEDFNYTNLGHSSSENEIIKDYIEQMDTDIESLSFYPGAVTQIKIDDARRGLELVSDRFDVRNIDAIRMKSHETLQCCAFHSYHSANFHDLKPCELKDLSIISVRSKMPVYQGGLSQSFSKVSSKSHEEVSDIFQKDLLWNNFSFDTFTSSFRSFETAQHKKFCKRRIRQPIFHQNQNHLMGMLASKKPNQLTPSKNNSDNKDERNSKNSPDTNSFAHPTPVSTNLTLTSGATTFSNLNYACSTNVFLSSETGKKCITHLYKSCRELEESEQNDKCIADFYSKMRSLPL